MDTFTSVLAEHIELAIFAILILIFVALGQFLKHKYGTIRKRHYKKAWFEMMLGILFFYYWWVLEGEFLIWGLSGIILFLHGIGLLGKFGPKKKPDEDTTLR